MVFVNYGLKYIFGPEDNNIYYVKIPTASAEIVSRCQSIYFKILAFFSSKDKTQDELRKAYNNLFPKLNSPSSLGETTGITYKGSAYLDKLKEIDKQEIIDSILTGKNTQDRSILYSIFFSMLWFCFFEYDGEIQNTRYNSNLSSNIFIKAKKYDYVYVVDDQSSFYKLLNKLNPAWGNSDSRYRDGSDNYTQIKTESVLKEGYYIYNNNLDAFFASEDNQKQLVSYAIDKNIELYQRIGTTLGNVLYLEFGNTMYSCFCQRIQEVINYKITSTETILNNEEDSDSLGFALQLNDDLIMSASGSNSYINFYVNFYNYALKLLNNYIENIKNKKDSIESRKEILENDEYIEKLLNSIIGVSKEDGGNNLSIKFDENFDFKLKIFDYENQGRYIADYLVKFIQYDKNDLSAGNVSKDRIKTIDDKNSTIVLPNGTITYPQYSEPIKNALEERKNSGEALESYFFFEKALYKNNITYYKNDENNEELKRKIDFITKISGNILYKISLLLFYKLIRTENPYITGVPSGDESSIDSMSITGCSYNLKQRFTAKNAIQITLNDEPFYNFKDFYSFIGKRLVATLVATLDIVDSNIGASENEKNVIENNREYSEYVKQRLSGKYYTEKDYFYIGEKNDKRLPNNAFVDIEFKVTEYDKNGENPSEVWIPITSIRKNNVSEDIVFNKSQEAREVHAGTYFDSMELTDIGGDTKEINLVLKSSNDINLENIIFNSLSSDSRTRELLSSGRNINNIFDELNELVERSESNFRIRFGYRDISRTDNQNNPTAIVTSNNDDRVFINRTKISDFGKPLPVEIYPWTYFKITGLSSEITNGQDTYTIKGVSSGSYLLSNFTLCGIPKNFSDNGTEEDYYGRPRNVIGKIAKWVMEASSKIDNFNNKKLTTARICFLGDKDGTIINDVDWNENTETNIFKTEYEYKLENGGTFKGGDIETIENGFFDSTQGEGTSNKKLAAKNFSLKSDARTLSIKEILDNLIVWLPSRVYYIGKIEGSEKTAAIWLPYENIYRLDGFFEKYPFKTERLKYQILEANAKIFPRGQKEQSETEYQKTYFIRVYFEGPGMSVKEGEDIENTENEEYLRVYNYRSLQQQVIENISISCPDDSELGQTISSVALLGSGQSLVYSFNKSTGTINEDCASISNSKTKSQKGNMFVNSEAFLNKNETWDYMNSSPKDFKPYLAFNNSKYIFLNSQTINNDSFPNTESAFREEATRFFTDLQNKQYTGEMTILGDPFYYFDASLQPAKYEIFLQMNRMKDSNLYQDRNIHTLQNIRSKYTGIYFITGIKHSIDTEGKFRTTLSISKRVFGSGKTTNSDKADEDKENEDT